jgi:response regulator RpfG family c-di-GMP phosphodiesterase
MIHKVLCVDDEPNVLQAFQRALRRQFVIQTASGGAEGLEAIAAHGPFAVVVSDMRMPGMDGVQFLAAVKQKAPNSVRVMLTGTADQTTAIRAVNEGHIFRFLTKPCPPEDLVNAINAGIRQYQLITVEKELLGKTLRGCVKVLNEVLSLTNPTAFGRATRVHKLVGQLCRQMEVERSWECEVAALLSQIGCVTIPPDILERFCRGQTLLRREIDTIQSHPATGCALVSNIPRLEGVAQILAYQQKGFDGGGVPDDDVKGPDIPLGARMLKVALDYDEAQWKGCDEIDAITQLAGRPERYDPQVLAALREVIGLRESLQKAEVRIKELAPGMLLAEDVKTAEGMVVVAKGQDVTPALCERIRNFARHRKINEPIAVLTRVAETADAG